jgi:hypothetical protein
MYAISLSGVKVIAENRTDGAGGWSIQLSGSSLAFYFAGAWNPSNTLSVAKWHHVALVRSSSTTTLYVDGISKGTTASDAGSTASNGMFIGARSSPNYEFPGFISNFRVVKGTAVYTSNFTPPTAPLTNITNTKLLCCQSTTSATAAAVIPTGSFTANGNAIASKFSPFMPDNINAVRGQESGYATYLPFGNDTTYSDGNLRMVTASPGYGRNTQVNTAITLGQKFFLEFTVNSDGASSDVTIGIDDGASWSTYTYASNGSSNNLDADFRGYRSGGGTFVGATYTSGNPGISYNDGDVIGLAIDRVNHQNQYYKNGVRVNHQNQYYKNGVLVYTHSISSTVDNYYPCIQTWTGAADVVLNSGQKPFKYAPPEGFKTLCLANLPRPTKAAVRPDKYFKTLLYTGNQTARNITGTSFQPDFVWLKSRTGTSVAHHGLFDSVRGANNGLYSSLNYAEAAFTQTLTSFNSDGFSLGTDADWGGSNWSGTTYVAWCWKAGGAAVSNTDGSITSQVSVNQDAGFSIVTYTGTGANATVGHGLGTTPSFYVVKPRSVANNWPCWHKDLTNDGYYIHLNFALKQDLATSVWNNTGPSSTVFNIGTNTNVNQQDATFVAYCWSEVPGFSKIGSYTGNGNVDGPFVHQHLSKYGCR